ncbi:hypothetical protein ACFP2T_27755 [Plantactinospora solaniradicis]|uniref:DUF3040 domain-containing protein n=1 Tax=Plantactinospora solaniradicis TaxID=1723736 RepID=A0ABW1KG35_9ACTN
MNGTQGPIQTGDDSVPEAQPIDERLRARFEAAANDPDKIVAFRQRFERYRDSRRTDQIEPGLAGRDNIRSLPAQAETNIPPKIGRTRRRPVALKWGSAAMLVEVGTIAVAQFADLSGTIVLLLHLPALLLASGMGLAAPLAHYARRVSFDATVQIRMPLQLALRVSVQIGSSPPSPEGEPRKEPADTEAETSSEPVATDVRGEVSKRQQVSLT